MAPFRREHWTDKSTNNVTDRCLASFAARLCQYRQTAYWWHEFSIGAAMRYCIAMKRGSRLEELLL